MIELHKLSHAARAVPAQPATSSSASTPRPTATSALTTGVRIAVCESVDEVVERIRAWRVDVPRAGPAPRTLTPVARPYLKSAPGPVDHRLRTVRPNTEFACPKRRSPASSSSSRSARRSTRCPSPRSTRSSASPSRAPSPRRTRASAASSRCAARSCRSTTWPPASASSTRRRTRGQDRHRRDRPRTWPASSSTTSRRSSRSTPTRSTRSRRPAAAAIDGIAKIDDRLVVLLDPEGIVGAAAPCDVEAARGSPTTCAPPPRPAPVVLAAARTAKPSRILVADDSTFMRRLLTQALRDAGFEVVGAGRRRRRGARALPRAAPRRA